MSLQSRVADLITAIGADIKALQDAPAGAAFAWTTITGANVSPAVTNTGYVMETGGVQRTVTLPANAPAGFNIAVNASAGSVLVLSNGNTIDEVGAGNNLLLLDGNTASLVAKTTGQLEIVYGGTSSGVISDGSITSVAKITQAAYDALSPPSATTLYVIVG